MHVLKISILDTCPDAQYLKAYYGKKVNNIGYSRDCGVDLVVPMKYELSTNKVTKIGLGIRCEFIPAGETESGPFQLVPRSSISATPLSLANQIGIIDPEYRGQIIAAVRCHIDRDHQSTMDTSSYTINQGDRLFQIVAFDGKPIRVELVEELSQTARGSNGFGSTGTKI